MVQSEYVWRCTHAINTPACHVYCCAVHKSHVKELAQFRSVDRENVG